MRFIRSIGCRVAVQEQLYGAKIGTPIELPKRNSTFPISAEEVTAEWLTNAIVPQPARDQGVKVSSFTFGGVGEIHGYAGLASMVNDIQYEGHYVRVHCLGLSRLPRSRSTNSTLSTDR